MNATELSQIVVDPEDELTTSEHLWIASQADQDDPFWSTVKITIGKLLHPLGIHTWVRWRHYDAASDTVLDMNGVVCTWCPKAKYL